MELESYLPGVHTAFNPVVINVSPSTGETEGELKINIEGLEIIRKKEFFNDVAHFDISGIIRKFFKNSIEETDQTWNPGIHKTYLDKMLFVKYSTEATSENGWDIGEICALNAVAQISESSDKTSLINTFLTRFAEYIIYEGYPISAYILTGGSDDTTLKFYYKNGSNDSCHTQQNLCVITSPLISPSGTSLDLLQISTPGELHSIIFIKYAECIPEYPFYVRWINNIGGREHWMFTKKSVKRKAETKSSFNPVVLDQSTATGFEEKLEATGEKKVVVGSGFVNKMDYEIICDMIYSTNIQWFNESTQKWVTITFDDSENEQDILPVNSEIEYTFKLPEFKLQL